MCPNGLWSSLQPVIFGLKPSPHPYFHPQTNTKCFSCPLKIALWKEWDFSPLRSPSRSQGESIESRENRKSVWVHQFAKGRKAQKSKNDSSMKSGKLRPQKEGVTCHHIWLVANKSWIRARAVTTSFYCTSTSLAMGFCLLEPASNPLRTEDPSYSSMNLHPYVLFNKAFISK